MPVVQFTPGFDLVGPGAAEAAVLTMVRVSALVVVAPMFSSKAIPVTLRTAIVLALTALLQPAARTHVAGALAVTPGAVVAEMTIGFAIGAGAAILVAAAELAGELISIQLGLSGEVLLDPVSGTSNATLGRFISLFVVTLLFVTNGHAYILQALADSFTTAPLGHPINLGTGFLSLFAQGSSMFALGLRLAAPVVATALVGTGALAALARAVPQLNVMSIAFPVQIALGLAVLAAAIPFFATEISAWGDSYQASVAQVLGALTR